MSPCLAVISYVYQVPGRYLHTHTETERDGLVDVSVTVCVWLTRRHGSL